MIDIVIPVYNTPINDLTRCLDSIYNQPFADYKVYIIDDGSKEEIRNFIDSYVVDKDNFIVKHIHNSGASHARNIGILLSNSKYITFVDSDDVIEKNFLREAVQLMEDYDLDIVIGGHNEIKNNVITKQTKCEAGIHIYENETLKLFFDRLLSTKLKLSNKEIKNAPIGKINRVLRRSAIGAICFNENIKMSEDTLFMIDLVPRLQKIGLVDKIWYNYYQNEYSTCHNKNYKELISNIMTFAQEIYKRELLEKDIEIKNAYLMRLFKIATSVDSICTRNNDDILKSKILNNKIFKETFSKVDFTKYIDITEKEKSFLEENNGR